jgi:hypothetical protein
MTVAIEKATSGGGGMRLLPVALLAGGLITLV